MTRNQAGHPNFVTLPGASVPPVTANAFGSGCIAIANNGKIYSNAGTYQLPVWAVIGMNPFGGSNVGGYFEISVLTNGTTPVNVFGAAGAPCPLAITNIVSCSQDTTAGNIITKQAANTVGTIAKGTTSGVLVGVTTISNATYATGDVCTVESSSAGNSRVLITFTIA